MSKLDLSLPDTVPEMSRYQDRPMTLDSFAIYNLLSPSTEAPPNLVETCNSECPRDDYVHFRSAPNITSLENLIIHHLDTTVHDSFDPNYFLVVTEPEWQDKGVCIVTLGDEDGKPDAFMMKATDSGILLVNLQIGNTDWYEAKENYEFSGDNDDAQDPGSEGTFPDGAAKKKPATGSYIAFYAIPGIDAAQLIRDVEPFHDGKAPEDRVCRFEGFLKPDRDLVSQTSGSWHPQACMSNTYLCKMYFYIVDSKNYKDDGFLLCNVKEHKTKRVVCSQGVTVPKFCNIAQGDRGWDERD